MTIPIYVVIDKEVTLSPEDSKIIMATTERQRIDYLYREGEITEHMVIEVWDGPFKQGEYQPYGMKGA